MSAPEGQRGEGKFEALQKVRNERIRATVRHSRILSQHEPQCHRVKFLGFTHRLTKAGKVIRIIDPQNVKAERKKLRRMVNLVRKGRMTKRKVDECFDAWKNHAEKGNSKKLIKRMEQYYAEL